MHKLLTVLLLFIALNSFAGIQVDQTRVIYNGNEKSAALSIRNDSQETWMVQTWLDTGDAAANPTNLPIQVIPPILKLDGNQFAILRFIYSGAGLPTDRESVFWVNVQEIPPLSEKNNVLQIAIRTRIKLFYRPVGLNTNLQQVAQKLTWLKKSNQLVVTNNGTLHVSFGFLTLKKGVNTWQINANMVAPMSSLSIPLPKGAKDADHLTFSFINEYGGQDKVENIKL